ncbi:hypothetical protein CSA80_04985 [Candidatus Saccharibacteria bacterium]|nr:MAG: hypothetical protein CSA80_04985 [Candidatus Saccharibacteria bacterium]
MSNESSELYGGEQLSPCEKYQYIFGRLCLPEFQTPDFEGSGLVGVKILGFYALLRDDGQLSLGVYVPADEPPPAERIQPLDIHSRWRPFTEALLADLTDFAKMPPWQQKKAREGADRGCQSANGSLPDNVIDLAKYLEARNTAQRQ